MNVTSLGHSLTLLTQYLRGPDDLAKISTIRKKLAQEKASIVAKLRSSAKDQLDATRDGLIKLRDTRLAVNHIREEMVNVERVCEDPRTAMEGFSKISEVSLDLVAFLEWAVMLIMCV
jgi:exocyst complex component 3